MKIRLFSLASSHVSCEVFLWHEYMVHGMEITTGGILREQVPSLVANSGTEVAAPCQMELQLLQVCSVTVYFLKKSVNGGGSLSRGSEKDELCHLLTTIDRKLYRYPFICYKLTSGI